MTESHRAEPATVSQPWKPCPPSCVSWDAAIALLLSRRLHRNRGLEVEQLAQALGLGAADGNLGVLAIAHPQLVGALETRQNLFDVVDIDEVGTVHAPEHAGIERRLQLFDGAKVGFPFELPGRQTYAAFLDRGEDQLLGIQQQQAPAGA